MPFIARIDDVGWVPPHKTNDAGLTYFQQWRDAFGIAGHPVVYGVIPSTVTDRELEWMDLNLSPAEELAVHGWDHAARAIVTQSQMQEARDRFLDHDLRCNSYIPPFNVYDSQTMIDWGHVCAGGYFFGGFRGDHHSNSNLPETQYDVIHLPAIRELYDRAGPLSAQVARWHDLQCPLVLTLHATWDVDHMEALRPLFDAIRDDLVSPEAVLDWGKRCKLDRKQLTAPHFLAYSWILKHVTPADTVLDFGSRYSVLPSRMALRGARVTVTDRDPKLEEYQNKLFSAEVSPGAKPADVRVWDGRVAWHRKDFHLVTSCWAIQHNLGEGEIPQIAKNLGDALRPNGKLLFVCSFTPGDSFLQTSRADPQWVLNLADHERLIMQPSGCVPDDVSFFRYAPNSGDGGPCSAAEANAICYVLRKPV